MSISIDRFRLALPNLPIDPTVIEKTFEFGILNKLPDASVTHRYDNRTGRRKATIQLLPNDALVIFAEEFEGRWRARSVSGTAGAILFGHNGRVLGDDYHLSAFLGRVRDLAGKVILPSHHDHIIPGESPKSHSYWSRLEIAVHIADPTGVVFRAMRNMRHPKIRKRASYYENETVSLVGKKVQWIVYDKTAEMTPTLEKYGAPVPPRILRFELRLGSAALTEHFTNPANFRKIEDRQRLVRFDLDDLKKVFLNFASGLEGVYANQPTREASAIARFIAKVSRRTEVPTLELAELYAVEKVVTAQTLSQLRSDSAAHYAALGETTAADLFSDEAFADQPSLVVKRLERAVGDLVDHYAFKIPAITRAYTGYGEQPDGRFIPTPSPEPCRGVS